MLINCEIDTVYKSKFLGVVIDSKLNWKDHIAMVKLIMLGPLNLAVLSILSYYNGDNYPINHTNQLNPITQDDHQIYAN